MTLKNRQNRLWKQIYQSEEPISYDNFENWHTAFYTGYRKLEHFHLHCIYFENLLFVCFRGQYFCTAWFTWLSIPFNLLDKVQFTNSGHILRHSVDYYKKGHTSYLRNNNLEYKEVIITYTTFPRPSWLQSNTSSARKHNPFKEKLSSKEMFFLAAHLPVIPNYQLKKLSSFSAIYCFQSYYTK